MLLRTIFAPLFVSLVLVLITGCGRSPTASLYTLEFSHTRMEQSANDPDAISLGLRQVMLPPVLNKPQIVLIENEKVQALEYHRWSEPLDVAMLRILSYELRDEFNSSSILSYPWPSAFKPKQVLTINVARFNGLPGQSVELSGVWVLSDELASQTVRTERFQIIEKVEGDDYSALVRAHSVALKKFAAQLADALAEN